MKAVSNICGLVLCFSLCQTVSSASYNNVLQDAEVEEMEYGNISRNLTRCSSTQVKTSSGPDIKIVATYSYEARVQRKINFGINLSIIHNNKEIVLPVQISTTPVVMQQRFYNSRGYSRTLEYVFTLTWPNVLQAFENIFKSKDGTGDALLRFFITAYFPNEPAYLGSETCQELGSTIFELPTGATKLLDGIPPYLKHANSMLHDDRYTDLILKFGDVEIPAHRIILATSSPVFSSLIYNGSSPTETKKPNHNESVQTEITIDENITIVALEEMLRYIYTGKVDSIEQIAEHVIVAAEIYSLPELKRICETVLLAQLKPENSIEMYSLGNKVNASKLTLKALTLMKTNKASIVNKSEEFRKLTTKYPNLMFELFVS